MAYTQLKPRHTPGALVEEISPESAHYRLSIPSGFADSYRLAQADDYTKIPRGRFPHRAPLSLSLLARASSDSIAGTWGFGLWNDPFGLSLGFGGSPFRLPALPNAAWFFGASEENYLSFKEPPRAEHELPANGFIAQAFRAPKFHPLLILAGLVLPFSRRVTRRLLGRLIEEDAVQLWSPAARHRVREQVSPSRASRDHADAPALQRLSVDPTQWHSYSLEWREKWVSFEVDNMLMLESPMSPNPPLGLVIWIDNQYAAFTPKGKVGFGALANPEPAWLEIKEIQLE